MTPTQARGPGRRFKRGFKSGGRKAGTRNALLEIEIGLDKVEYSLREGEGLVIHHETEEVQLSREQPVVVRPVSRW